MPCAAAQGWPGVAEAGLQRTRAAIRKKRRAPYRGGDKGPSLRRELRPSFTGPNNRGLPRRPKKAAICPKSCSRDAPQPGSRAGRAIFAGRAPGCATTRGLRGLTLWTGADAFWLVVPGPHRKNLETHTRNAYPTRLCKRLAPLLSLPSPAESALALDVEERLTTERYFSTRK